MINFMRVLAVLSVFSMLGLVRADHPSGDLPPISIVLVGDSTVTPTAGWGNGFTASLNPQAKVTNLSAGGRSSRSFINEGRWTAALALKPNYVLIQFGHNDQKINDPTRGTDPQTTYKQFMTQYVDDARAAGIVPVLVTSLSRRQWGPDGKIHSTLTPYADVVKQIAAEKHVPLLNLHDDSIKLYETIGRSAVDALSPSKPATGPNEDPTATTQPKTVLDGTHLNAQGSVVVGRLVANELAAAVPALSPYVLPVATKSASKAP